MKLKNLISIAVVFFSFLLIFSGCTPAKSYRYKPLQTPNEIKPYLVDLKSPIKEKKIKAANYLAEYAFGEEVERGLIDLFNDKDPQVQQAAFSALQYISQKTLLNNNLKKLGVKNPVNRERGVRALAYINEKIYWKDKRVLDGLLFLLRDPERSVQMAVMEVFYKRHDNRGLPDILELLLDGKSAKSKEIGFYSKVADSIVGIGKPGVPLLLDKLKDQKYQNVAKDILEILSRIKEPVVHELLAMYEQVTPIVRNGIIHYLSNLQNEPELETILADLLYKEINPYVRISIIRSLRKENVKSTGLSLYSLVEYLNIDPTTQSEVVETLTYKAKEMVPELLEIYKSTENVVIQIGVLNILSGIKTPEAYSGIVTLMEQDESQKGVIFPYVAPIFDSRLAKMSIEEVKNNDAYNKKYAIDWLKQHGFNFRKDILLLMKNNAKEVRLDAIDILHKIGTQDLTTELIDFYKKEPDEAIRRKIILAVSQSKADEVIHFLLEELGGQKGGVLEVNAVAIALIRIGKPVAPYLIKLLENDVKAPVAAYILGKIGDLRAYEPIKELIRRKPKSGVFVYTKSKDPDSYFLEQVDAVEDALKRLESKKIVRQD